MFTVIVIAVTGVINKNLRKFARSPHAITAGVQTRRWLLAREWALPSFSLQRKMRGSGNTAFLSAQDLPPSPYGLQTWTRSLGGGLCTVTEQRPGGTRTRKVGNRASHTPSPACSVGKDGHWGCCRPTYSPRAWWLRTNKVQPPLTRVQA